MTCTNEPGACKCEGEKIYLRMFCPQWRDPERPRDKIDDWQCTQWQRIPEAARHRCLELLRQRVPLIVRTEWQDQAARGVAIGSTDVRFHLGVGMAVRNVLREVLRDKDLPGGGRWTWDDFYRGALYDLVSSHGA